MKKRIISFLPEIRAGRKTYRVTLVFVPPDAEAPGGKEVQISFPSSRR